MHHNIRLIERRLHTYTFLYTFFGLDNGVGYSHQDGHYFLLFFLLLLLIPDLSPSLEIIGLCLSQPPRLQRTYLIYMQLWFSVFGLFLRFLYIFFELFIGLPSSLI